MQFGTVFVKRLEMMKNQAVSVSHGNCSGIAQIFESVRQDLNWWVDNLQSAFSSVKANLLFITIYTNASSTGRDGGRGEWSHYKRHIDRS